MNRTNPALFVRTRDRLPLVTESGNGYLGLMNSTSPELCNRVRVLFDHLNGKLGFRESVDGQAQQECFNFLLRYAYPEVMIDLADLVYAQHERPMVFLNFDHININLHRDLTGAPANAEVNALNRNMDFLFHELAATLKREADLYEDPEIIRLLAESYSYYLYQTRNFPWEEPLAEDARTFNEPVLDVATGLVGFSLIHDWPLQAPMLYLTDKMPFIQEGLAHFKDLLGKKNVEILRVNFPEEFPSDKSVGRIWANKFLHHLQRPERKAFLASVRRLLRPRGILSIVDTDLEYQILQQAREPMFREKLIPGYLDTLVEIEPNFCKHLLDDITDAGLRVRNFDFHEYLDETDAYSRMVDDNVSIKFLGFEIVAERETGS